MKNVSEFFGCKVFDDNTWIKEDVEAESYMIRDAVLGKMEEFRSACDETERITAKKY